MTNPSERWTRVPAILSFPDTPGFTEAYGFAGASGKVWLEGQYLLPRERPSKTLYLFMHPSSTLHLLPMPAALATPDKEYVRIEGATHYYQNQPAQLHQCITAVLDWSRRKGLLAD